MRCIPFLLLAAAVMLFEACSSPDYPEFQKMENVKFSSISFTGGVSVTLNGDAVFHNPNPIGAKVTEIDFDLFINDKKVTHIRQDVSENMKANSDFTLPLQFKIPLKEVFKDLKPTIGNIFKKQKINYHMLGTLKVGLGSVEVAVPIDYADEEELKYK